MTAGADNNLFIVPNFTEIHSHFFRYSAQTNLNKRERSHNRLGGSDKKLKLAADDERSVVI